MKLSLRALLAPMLLASGCATPPSPVSQASAETTTLGAPSTHPLSPVPMSSPAPGSSPASASSPASVPATPASFAATKVSASADESQAQWVQFLDDRVAAPAQPVDRPGDQRLDQRPPAPNLRMPDGTAESVAPPRSAPAPEEEADPLPLPPVVPLSLDDVVTAVYASYPALDIATRERQIAAGKHLATLGEFDVVLTGEALSEPLGFYENYRYGLGVKRYTWLGAQTFAGYRLGRGEFEPWYLERETNKGGEFKTGFALPFLRDRDIDKRRAAVFKARIDRTAVEPMLQLEVLDAVRSASLFYWDWVSAGQRVRIGRQVLELATERQEGLERRVAQGDLAEIELIDNRRLIVSRQAKLTELERKWNQATIKLSLFLRDPSGRPLLASFDQLPPDFPAARRIDPQEESAQITQALTRRPEFWLLNLQRQQADVELREAANLSLPSLDGVLAASQDVGEPTSSKRDKSPFELEAGAMLDVPLQRRAARGKAETARGKIAQIAAKRRFTEQKVVTEVQSARAGLIADYTELQQAMQSVSLAEQLEKAERQKFERGDSNLLLVNLREQAAADAMLLVVDAASDYFASQALLHAAIAAELDNRQ